MPPVKASSSNFVTVACKVPNGMILQVYNQVEGTEPCPSGYRKVKISVKDGDPFRVHGPAKHLGEAHRVPIVMGYALTRKCPLDLWERWLKANKDSDIVKNHLIFANPDNGMLRDDAKEKRKVRSGMEPMLQKDDPRRPLSRFKKMKIQRAKESNTGEEGDTDPDNVEIEE